MCFKNSLRYNTGGVVQHFFIIIISLFIVVMLFIVGFKVINELFCTHTVSALSSDVSRLKQKINRAYNSAIGEVVDYDINVPRGTKYCFRGGQVYIESRCVAKGFDIDHLIVHNTEIPPELRSVVNEMAVIIDEDAEDISTATICLSPGFYRIKFERTKSKVNLIAIYGSRDRG